ncbi:MAG: aminoacyl-tRNA hydrolase [Nitrospirota bacterium]|nr:aminoacyl-tRNA hydrolase [Nitrospirota bacterium]
MKVVLGLANPGPRYAATRHNVGAEVVACLAGRWGIRLEDRKDCFVGGQGEVAGIATYLAVSRVYMNTSGEAVRALWGKLGRQASNLVVIHDELDLPVGRVRLKDDGGDGGHRGVRSVIESIGTRAFARIRVGIGRPDDPEKVRDYVLEHFAPAERQQATAAVERAADAAEALLREGLLAAQTRVHPLS